MTIAEPPKPDPDMHERFGAAMQALEFARLPAKIAVGVSGGGDSLALALLLQDWAKEQGVEVLALTVDHGLRAGSKDEAVKTGALLKQHGLRHKILDWEGDKPLSHIQERARNARYALLRAACHAEKISVLAVAHNAEDQIETFWMRLAKGSGLDGLTAMAPRRALDTQGAQDSQGALELIRPLLGFSRADLRCVCAGYGAAWLDDPSNVNEQFLRVKLRQFEDLLGGEGLTPQRLSLVLQKLEDARGALQAAADELLLRAAKLHDAGYIVLNRALWRAAHPEIQRRSLSRLLHSVAPQLYAAGAEALEHTRRSLLQDDFAGRTLAGCEVFPGKENTVFICREADAAAPRQALKEGMVWDDRFLVSGYRQSPDSPPTAARPSIGILGETGLVALRKALPADSPALRELEALPFKVKKILPAFWDGENPVRVPCLNWEDAQGPASLKACRLTFVAPGALLFPEGSNG